MADRFAPSSAGSPSPQPPREKVIGAIESLQAACERLEARL
ncbi:hypothetical protein [Phenylobacterium sp.]|nr:hypothetical protein [Phenylobacterium sp.]MDO8379315.1 hypothetical protein [Phenylobacterium sp.]